MHYSSRTDLRVAAHYLDWRLGLDDVETPFGLGKILDSAQIPFERLLQAAGVSPGGLVRLGTVTGGSTGTIDVETV